MGSYRKSEARIHVANIKLDFGYYHIATDVKKHGNHLEAVAPYCTFAMVNPKLDYIRQCKDFGMKAVVNIGSYMNRDNWRSHLYNYRDELQASGLLPDVLAFYTYDEPYWKGKTYYEFNKWCRVLKKRCFPNTDLWTTFAYPVVDDTLKIPKFLDRVSITPDYGDFTLYDMIRMLNVIKTKMHTHQSIILTADGFHRGGIPNEIIQRAKANIFRDYFRYARDTKKITGLWTFLYPSFSKGTGVKDMPVLKRMVERIGTRVTAAV